jgi:hypothetical protein
LISFSISEFICDSSPHRPRRADHRLPLFGTVGVWLVRTSALDADYILSPPCPTVKRIMPFLAPRKPAQELGSTPVSKVLDAVQAASCVTISSTDPRLKRVGTRQQYQMQISLSADHAGVHLRQQFPIDSK